MLEVIVRRRLALFLAPDAAGIACIEEVLRGLTGVVAADVNGAWLVCAYRLPDTCLARLESALASVGVALSRRWQDHLRRALIRYSEGCRLPALAAERRGAAKACCNRPPK